MTISDDLPREYHDRDLQEAREKNLALISLNARAAIFGLFSAERQRQIAKWGWDQQTHPDGTSPDFAAERDDYRAYCDRQSVNPETNTWVNILREEVFEAFCETDPKRLEKELVQAGAVITNWLEDLRGR